MNRVKRVCTTLLSFSWLEPQLSSHPFFESAFFSIMSKSEAPEDSRRKEFNLATASSHGLSRFYTSE